MALTERIFTKTITNTTFTVVGNMGFNAISFVLVSGAGSFTGTLNVAGTSSTAIDLVVGTPVTITANGQYPLDELTITASAGVVNFLGRC